MNNRISILGLGEAGRLFGEDFAQLGAKVSGYDPFISLEGDHIFKHESLSSAVKDTDLVISTVGPNAAINILEEAAPHLNRKTLFADFNTMAPDEKLAMNDIAVQAGVDFVDVAVMAPVPRAGSRTPLFVSGSQAERFKQALSSLHGNVTVVSETVGDAAAQKLVRSIFMKGLAAIVIETLEAAERVGLESILRPQIADEIGDESGEVIDRLVHGSKMHAKRRLHEMGDVSKYLNQIGVAHPMTLATAKRLELLLGEQ